MIKRNLAVLLGMAALMAEAQAPAPVVTGVVQGASFRPGISPATWITIRGQNLSTTTRSWEGADFKDGVMPTEIDGVSVRINGKAAYPAYVSPTQINLLSPDETMTGTVQVEVTNRAVRSQPFNATIQAVAPGMFAYSNDGGKIVIGQSAANEYLAPGEMIPNFPTRPAKAGEVVTVYGTGFGPSQDNAPANSPTQPVSQLRSNVTATLGGQSMEVIWAGLIGPGLAQINLRVPQATIGGLQELVIRSGTVASPSGVRLAVEPRSGAPTACTGTPQRLTGDAASSIFLSVPRPTYPSLAIQARIQGTVRHTVVVSPSGAYCSSTLASGHPLLIPAAAEVLRLGRYGATGTELPAAFDVDVVFSLANP